MVLFVPTSAAISASLKPWGTKTCLCFEREVKIEFEAEHKKGFELLFFSFYIVECTAVDCVR